MESIHGIDVSWIHHSGKDHHHGRKDKPAKSSNEATPNSKTSKTSPTIAKRPGPNAPGNSPPRSVPSRPRNDSISSAERTLSVQNLQQRSPSPARKGSSWLSSLSSKFSSAATAPMATLSPPNMTAPVRSPSPKPVLSPGIKSDSIEKPYIPAPPKSSQSSFLQSALRRLSSSGGGLSGSGKGSVHGLCERRTLNIDKDRERCNIPDLNLAKLRRVAFCVDVEIAGGPRYKDEEDERKEKKQKKKQAEKGEGEALKNLEPVAESKKDNGDHSHKDSEQFAGQDGKSGDSSNTPAEDRTDEHGEKESKKKEKKRRSEEERKARKEKKKKQAQINGSLPVELTRTGSEMSMETSLTSSLALTQASPTTDPVRIYRRCCQLRETPILKKITEQLANPANCRNGQPGYVNKLDLTNYPMNLADLVTLGDYLAVVPIKDVILENCGLTDEGVRVVLAGLLAAKQPEYGKKRRRHTLERVSRQSKQGGVVERLILKNNPKLGRAGWGHISLFINMCRSIKYFDVSMNPFPTMSALDVLEKLERVNTKDSIPDTSSILSRALGERLAKAELEFLNMAETGIDTEQLGAIIDGIIKSGLRRLTIAGNHITPEGMDHIARYLKEGKCEVLDIGGNDLAEQLPKIADSLSENHPLWALSLADCGLTPDALAKLFPALTKLPNLRFINLSHNHSIFGTIPSSLSLLRRYLPKMPNLKRVHLSDTSMTAAQAIALAEILPESPSIAHIIMLENPALTALANAKGESEQEEACALYASLMAAVRVSKTLICIDVDVPSPDSSEIVKALAKQVVAYSLRNMEHGPVAEIDQAAKALTEPHNSDVQVSMPDVLLHIVGQTDDAGKDGKDEPAPDDDYIIGGGVAKALNICLRNSVSDLKRPELERTLSSTTLDTPTHTSGGKAKDMSKNLLDSARKIRARLQPAMVREGGEGERLNHTRLQFLDTTLERMIQRFEDEYPETRLQQATTPPHVPSPTNGSPSGESILSNNAMDDLEPVQIGVPASDEEQDLNLNISLRPTLVSHNSGISIASKAQTQEEGRIHRVGQQFRRDILKPETPSHSPETFPSSPISKTNPEISDHHHGLPSSSSKSKIDEEFNKDRRHEPQHHFLLRAMVEEVGGEEIKKRLEEGGQEEVIRELADEAGLLRRRLMEQDPDGWEKFREAQIKAQRNSMVMPSSELGVAERLRGLERAAGEGNVEDESAIDSD